MLNKKEIIYAALAILVMTLTLSFVDYNLLFEKMPLYLIFSAIIILISIFSKKITAKIIDVSVEIKSWEWKRYGIYARSEFKKPIPTGFVLPLLLSLLFSYRYFFCLLQFDSTALTSKAAKKYGKNRISGLTEWDEALIIFYSIIPLIILALFVKFTNISLIAELSRITMFYVLWNLVPVSKLDGTKLFFASRPLFTFTWILTLIASAIVFI